MGINRIFMKNRTQELTGKRVSWVKLSEKGKAILLDESQQIKMMLKRRYDKK